MNGFPYAFFGILPDGEEGQVLKKKSNASYDVEWAKGGGLSGEAFTFVAADSPDPLVNGASLIAAYEAAKLLTPYGAALSATNRYTILMGDGTYSMGDDSDIFGLNAEFIDLRSVSGNQVNFLESVIVAVNDVRLNDVNCAASKAIYVYGDQPNTIITNCISRGDYGFTIFNYGPGVNNSKYINCVGYAVAFSPETEFAGTAINCVAGYDGNLAFGSDGTLTGTLISCRLIEGTFQTVSGAGRTYFCIDGNGDINNQ